MAATISISKMMLTKEVRTQARENGIRSKQVEEAAALCEDHIEAERRLKENKAELSRLRRLMGRAESRFEISLYKPDAERLEAELEEDDRKVGLFHWALYNLPDEYSAVMEQLYDENLTWRSVCDMEGNPMPLTAVKRARDNALVLMAIEFKQRKESAKVTR